MTKCPICKKATKEEFRPFCSKKCTDIDLLQWLSDAYVVPSQMDLSEDDIEQISKELEKNLYQKEDDDKAY